MLVDTVFGQYSLFDLSLSVFSLLRIVSVLSYYNEVLPSSVHRYAITRGVNIIHSARLMSCVNSPPAFDVDESEALDTHDVRLAVCHGVLQCSRVQYFQACQPLSATHEHLALQTRAVLKRNELKHRTAAHWQSDKEEEIRRAVFMLPSTFQLRDGPRPPPHTPPAEEFGGPLRC